MTDIVERLRDRPSICYENEGCYLLGIAADEIERLRHENENLLSRAIASDGAVQMLQAEIERLRGILEFIENASRQEAEGLRAEIERLQAALRDALADVMDQRAEVEQLP